MPVVSVSTENSIGTEAFPIEEGVVAPVLIASTDIRQAEIMSQVGQEVVLLFNLRKKFGRQSDITYGVELYEGQEGGGFCVCLLS